MTTLHLQLHGDDRRLADRLDAHEAQLDPRIAADQYADALARALSFLAGEQTHA